MSFPQEISSSACSREIRATRTGRLRDFHPCLRNAASFSYLHVARAYSNNCTWCVPNRERSWWTFTRDRSSGTPCIRSGPFHYHGEGRPDVVFQHGGVSIWLSPVVLSLNRLWRPYATGRGRVSRYRRYFSLRADNEKHDRHQAPAERDSCAIEQQVGPGIDSRSVNRTSFGFVINVEL